MRAILGVIQFLYLNSNMSLVINPPKCVRKRILKNHFMEAMNFRLLNLGGRGGGGIGSPVILFSGIFDI